MTENLIRTCMSVFFVSPSFAINIAVVYLATATMVVCTVLVDALQQRGLLLVSVLLHTLLMFFYSMESVSNGCV